jgi:molecular chaperone GrpE (heat shock protein)
MLRVFLIVAILAGLGVIGVSQFVVKPHIQEIITEREKLRADWQRELARANKLDKNLKETTAKLEETTKKLEETSNQLAAANKKIEDQTGQIAKLQGDLEQTSARLNTASQKLAQWEFIGLSPDQVKLMVDANRKMQATIAASEEEKKILARDLKATKAKLEQYVTGGEAVVELTPGLKGKITVVDPKWNFVVLDIGQIEGCLPNGVLMVSRDAKLVGKVKIVSVEQHRSIANIMPGWKLGEIMEGDQVIY